VRGDDNDYLDLVGLEGDTMLQIQGYSITYRIARGKQQGRKVFTLQAHCTYGRARACGRLSLHTCVMSNRQDMCKLERLCRYLF
jgi:hypothetical protein